MMKLGLFGAACVVALMLDFGIDTCTAGNNGQDELTRADLINFQSYVEENKAGKKWQTGPEPIDSEEIRKALGRARFYSAFVISPVVPGAPVRERLEEHQLRMKEYQDKFISRI